MNKDEIIELLVLGRDRLYNTLIQVQKAIDLTRNAGLNEVAVMLMFKEEDVKRQIDRASEIIKNFKETFHDDNE